MYRQSFGKALKLWRWLLYWICLCGCYSIHRRHCITCSNPIRLAQDVAMCELYASAYYIKFNVDKSKCMHDCAATWSPVFFNLQSSWMCFYLDGLCVENVSQYSHLGHIITNRLDDSDDIYSRWCNLVGQVNSILCYFSGSWFCCRSHWWNASVSVCMVVYCGILVIIHRQSLSAKHGAQGNETVFWPDSHSFICYCSVSYVASVSWNVQAICAFYHQMYVWFFSFGSVGMHSIHGFYFCHYQKYFHCV